jgi:putative transposase
VRVNIVERAEDYPWPSAKSRILRERDDTLSDKAWLEDNEVNAYCEFLRYEDKKIESSIRKSTSTGRPFGSEEFLKILEKILEQDILPRKGGRPRKKTS